MRRIITICVVLCAVLPPLVALAVDFPVERIIEPPKSYKMQSTWVDPVTFPHALHARHESCGHCHHMETDQSTKSGDYMACSFCHNKAEEPNKTGFYNAWHASSDRSCVGCHMIQPRDTDPAPPKACLSGCHKYGEEQGVIQ